MIIYVWDDGSWYKKEENCVTNYMNVCIEYYKCITNVACQFPLELLYWEGSVSAGRKNVSKLQFTSIADRVKHGVFELNENYRYSSGLF